MTPSDPAPRLAPTRRALLVLLVLASGACGLVYQVLWVRASLPVFGVGVHAISAVIAAFMAGLGFGAWLSRPLLAEWRARPLLLYAALEIAIGLTAVVVPPLLERMPAVYAAAFPLATGSPVWAGVLRFGLCLLLFGVPTVFMGATLPVLTEAFATPGHDNSRLIGALYGVNTLGAALGCWLAGFWLLPAFGVDASSLIAAGGNGLVALTAVLAGDWLARGPVQRPPPALPAPAGRPRAAAPSAPLLLLVTFTTGFVALGSEVAWTRMLLFYLQSATHSFTTMLAVLLAGLALGSLVYARARLRDASWERSAGWLAAGLVALGLWSALVLHLVVRLDRVWVVLIDLIGAATWGRITLHKTLVTALVVLPPTFVLGWLFPLIARLLERRLGSASSTVATVYVVNTLGSLLGSVVTAFVLLETIGVQGALMLMAVLLVGLGWRIARRHAPADATRAGTGAAALAAALLVLFSPGQMLRRHYERQLGGEVLAYVEGAADTVIVHESRRGVRSLRYHDGRGTSSTSLNANHLNRLTAYSSMVMAPHARDVLVICLGVGNTASAFAAFPIETLDIVDLSEGCFEVAPLFEETNLGVLEDPRVRTFAEDGRNFLLRTDKRYDVIEIEPPAMHTDGVVYLYTREFHELARSRLAPGGVLTHWYDASQLDHFALGALLRTGLSVMPHATLWTRAYWWYSIAVEQDHDVTIDFPRVQALFSDPRVVEDMQRVHTSLGNVLGALYADGPRMRALVASVGEVPILTDDRTVLDFYVPRLRFASGLGGGVGYYTSTLALRFARAWREAGILEQPIGATGLGSEDWQLERVVRDAPPAVLEEARRARRWEGFAPGP